MFNSKTVSKAHDVRLYKLEAKVQALINVIDGYTIEEVHPEDNSYVRGINEELKAIAKYLDIYYVSVPATKKTLTCVKRKKEKTNAR